jgi:hypothetical protein
MVAASMAETRDPISVDAGVLEELLQALLEVAARKDALRSWPKDRPPERDPPVLARRDDDGTLGVFRFFTIIDPGAGGSHVQDQVRELTPVEARARLDGIDGHLKPGDEVGVELPLGRLAAIALADVDATRGGRAHLLPPRIVEMLGDEALADAVTARLSSLRGPPPHVPLRQLVTDFGGDVVEWTAVCAGEPGELIVLVTRGDEHKLVVVPSATSAAGHAALLRALAPQPGEQSLWRFLEVEGPGLLCGSEGALWSDRPVDRSSGEGDEERWGRRLSLEVKAITISRDPTVYAVARARARLLVWSDARIVEELEALVGLPVDLSRLVDEPWPEGDALDRVLDAAAQFRKRLATRLSALVDARAPTVHDVLGGAAFLRVLCRAAAGASLEADEAPQAEPPNLRDASMPDGDGRDDEIGLRVADVGVLVLNPAEDTVKLRTGEIDHELYVDGAVCDGDPEAWRAFTHAFAQAIVDAELDVELAFPVEGADPDDEEAELETVMLSAWLLGLGDFDDDDEVRWPPRAHGAESAAAFHVVVDRFVDPGPGTHAERSRGGRR